MGTINLGRARSVADGDVWRFDAHQVIDDHSSATLNDQLEDQRVLWDEAINCLLSWQSGRDTLFDEDDIPDLAVIRSALDFAYDLKQGESRAPTGIATSGFGRIMFEWRSDRSVTLVEFVELGTALVTVLKNGEVIATYLMKRDPISRQFATTG